MLTTRSAPSVSLSPAATSPSTVSGRPASRATRRVRLSLKSIRPFMAASVMVATLAPAPARAARMSITSACTSVESMSNTTSRRFWL